jgi:VWFA-related protein
MDKHEAVKGVAVLMAIAIAMTGGRPSARAVTPGQTPLFRSTVDLVAVDVQVVSREGEPISGLGIDDFEVTLNGHLRRIISVDFLKKEPVPPADAGGPELPISTPGTLRPGTRVFVLAVDSSTFATGGIKPAVQAAQHFLTRLQPDDMVALYVYPFEKPAIDLTHDHRAVSRALDRIVGRVQPFPGLFHLSLQEVIDITANDTETFARVVRRECSATDPTCAPSVHMEANAQASYYEAEAQESLSGLSLLLRGLVGLPGRKTVVLVSGGLKSGDRVSGRPDVGGFLTKVGAEAGESDTSLYVLHMDDSFFEAFSAAAPVGRDASQRTESSFSDSTAIGRGLERLAAAAGGALLRVQAGSGDWAFDRVLRESAAYYLVGVQPVVEDRDGKLHFLHVKVKKRGVTVRSRTHVVIPKR